MRCEQSFVREVIMCCSKTSAASSTITVIVSMYCKSAELIINGKMFKRDKKLQICVNDFDTNRFNRPYMFFIFFSPPLSQKKIHRNQYIIMTKFPRNKNQRFEKLLLWSWLKIQCQLFGHCNSAPCTFLTLLFGCINIWCPKSTKYSFVVCVTQR